MQIDIHKQPNSRNCFVCGVENPYGLKLEFFETNPGEITVKTVIPERFQGYPGMVHGGIVASLVDEVLGRVHMGSNFHKPRFMYTAKLTVQYRKPVPIGELIKIIGHAKKSKRHSATAVAQIFGPEGDLLVDADAILINIPEENFNSVNLEALGWKVYPD